MRVVKIYSGKDGSAQVCVKDSEGNIVKRPIQHLYPLQMKNFSPREYIENK